MKELGMSQKKLRLILWESCNRSCPGCCNKDWNLKALPKVDDFTVFDEIILTGGEPMLKPDHVVELVHQIREVNETAKIIVYTAHVNCDGVEFQKVLDVIDSMTITLHEPKDFHAFAHLYSELDFADKQMRLNVFEGVYAPDMPDNWSVKSHIEWIKDCPLPSGEVLMRL